jgi:sporulation protein YlmC with PRC-barrel domain
MLKCTLRASAALALVAAIAVVVPAQPTTKGPQAVVPVRAKSLLGAKVTLQAGTGVGTVDDIVFTDEGVVDYLIVSTGGKYVTVPWEAAKLNFEKRTAVIDLPAEQFQKIPTYTPEQYPNFYAPTYRTEVYRYYNLKPGQERRLERRVERK